MFAFICYVSIHLEISATSRGTPCPNPHQQALEVCGIGQGSVAKTEEAEGMSGSWRADRWPGTIFLSQGCFDVSQVCGLLSDDGQSRNKRAPDADRVNGNSIASVDPATGALKSATFSGSQPSTLAISDNNQYLYAGFAHNTVVERYASPAMSPDITIPLGVGHDGSQVLPVPGRTATLLSVWQWRRGLRA
jgi:hypothetical protein